jgi:hypothetical protein
MNCFRVASGMRGDYRFFSLCREQHLVSHTTFLNSGLFVVEQRWISRFKPSHARFNGDLPSLDCLFAPLVEQISTEDGNLQASTSISKHLFPIRFVSQIAFCK